MRQSRFTETGIVYAVKHVELGIPVREIARKDGVSEKTVYLWRRKYDGLGPSELKRLKDLERENGQLRRRVPHDPSRDRDGARAPRART